MATTILWLQVVIKQQEAESMLSGRCPQNHREWRASSVRTPGYEIRAFSGQGWNQCCKVQWTHVRPNLIMCLLHDQALPNEQLAHLGQSKCKFIFPCIFVSFFFNLFSISNPIPSPPFLDFSWFLLWRGETKRKNPFPFIKVAYWINSVYGRQRHPGTLLFPHPIPFVANIDSSFLVQIS